MIHTVINFNEEADNFFRTNDSSNGNSCDLQSLLAGANGHLSTTIVPPALEKTRMCVYYLQGRCKYDDCSFAHSSHELKQAPTNLRKTKLCDLFMMGHCYDASCNFAHSTDELKLKPKRSISVGAPGLLSPRSLPTSPPTGGFDRATHDRNTESCARTILSMLMKMQPEAAVAFLSNPECKAMLEKLLSKSSDFPPYLDVDSTMNTSVFSTPSSSGSSLDNLTGSFFR